MSTEISANTCAYTNQPNTKSNPNPIQS